MVSINFNNSIYTNMINSFSKVLVVTPITKTVSNVSGDETLTEGTGYNVSGAFFRQEDAWSQDKEGLFQGADAIVLFNVSTDLLKDYKVVFDRESYRVDKVVTRYLGDKIFYYMARCYKI